MRFRGMGYSHVLRKRRIWKRSGGYTHLPIQSVHPYSKGILPQRLNIFICIVKIQQFPLVLQLALAIRISNIEYFVYPRSNLDTTFLLLLIKSVNLLHSMMFQVMTTTFTVCPLGRTGFPACACT